MMAMKSRLCASVLAGLFWLATPLYALDIQSWQTDNGVRVLFVENHDLPIVDFRFNFKAGSSRDGDQPGISRLVSALLVEGTGDLSAGDIAERFESVGAELGHNSLRDMAWTSLRSLSEPELLDPMIDLFARVTALPSFPAASLERDRESMLLSLKSRKTEIDAVAEDAFYQALYPDHAYRVGSHGTSESLAKISYDDLQRFHQRYYVGRNAVLAIVGDLDPARARGVAERISRHLKPGEAASAIEPPKVVGQQEKRIPFKATQTHVYQGFPIMSRKDPDYYKLFLGNHILGGSGFGSRLMKEIREERGLSYSVYSYFIPMESLGPFEMSLQTKNHQADEAAALMQETLKQFIEKGPSADELKDAKLNITGGFPLKTDSNKKIVEYLAVIGFYDLPLDYLDSFNDRINAITLAEVKDAFKRRVDPERMVRIIVGGE